jgi:hypothetical protein
MSALGHATTNRRSPLSFMSQMPEPAQLTPLGHCGHANKEP